MVDKDNVQETKEAKEEAKTDSETQKILSMSELSLWLDTYDDIFSDFDPRPFTQRSLSVDFLDEIKRASRDKVSGQIELRFLIPEKDRNSDTESQIKKRLKEYFKKHYEGLKKKKNKNFIKAILFIILGFAMLIFAAFIASLGKPGFGYSAIVIFLEPAGWFTFWFSLEQLFESFSQTQPELEFHSKMAKAEISFISY